MARILKTSTKVLGLHPGALVYRGQSGDVQTIDLQVTCYNADFCKESQFATLDKCVEETKKTNQVSWVEFQGLSDKKIIEEVGNKFGIHRLWLEDVLNTEHRTKIEEMDKMLFAILKWVSVKHNKLNLKFKASQISIIFGENFVLSFSDKKDNVFEPVKSRIRESVWKIRTLKADYLFYALIDFMVDQYFLVLEDIEDYFEALEERVTDNINHVDPVDILNLKGDVLHLRKTIFPMKESLNKVIESGHPWIEKRNLHYFKDLQDHIVQIVEVSDYHNEISTSLMDFYQNTINRKMNEIMKVLTLFAAFFIPLTFIVGIYGMNFKFMPELDWKYGYLFVWLVIFGLIGFMFFIFKKNKWL